MLFIKCVQGENQVENSWTTKVILIFASILLIEKLQPNISLFQAAIDSAGSIMCSCFKENFVKMTKPWVNFFLIYLFSYLLCKKGMFLEVIFKMIMFWVLWPNQPRLTVQYFNYFNVLIAGQGQSEVFSPGQDSLP